MKFDRQKFVHDFYAGKVFAYPTEAVYGLGCDPQNEASMERILELKRRPVEKGVILIAGDIKQLTGYIDLDFLSELTQNEIKQTWPGPYTWLIPRGEKSRDWITGGSKLVAVRVTTHQLVKSMCEAVNSPLVSTSANLGGEPPAKSAAEVMQYFGQQATLIEGKLGNQQKPSTIINALTMQRIR